MAGIYAQKNVPEYSDYFGHRQKQMQTSVWKHISTLQNHGVSPYIYTHGHMFSLLHTHTYTLSLVEGE